jgi:hypothetical protein
MNPEKLETYEDKDMWQYEVLGICVGKTFARDPGNCVTTLPVYRISVKLASALLGQDKRGKNYLYLASIAP